MLTQTRKNDLNYDDAADEDAAGDGDEAVEDVANEDSNDDDDVTESTSPASAEVHLMVFPNITWFILYMSRSRDIGKQSAYTGLYFPPRISQARRLATHTPIATTAFRMCYEVVCDLAQLTFCHQLRIGRQMTDFRYTAGLQPSPCWQLTGRMRQARRLKTSRTCDVGKISNLQQPTGDPSWDLDGGYTYRRELRCASQ